MTATLRISGGAHAQRRTARRAWRLGSTIPTVILCVLLMASLVLLAGTMFGFRAFTIKSGSMTPTFAVGDVVIDKSVSPATVHSGDIVTFRDPGLGEQLVTHRVVSVKQVGDVMMFVTKGDANRVPEHWSVSTSGHLGREVARVPGAGQMLADVSTPVARMVEIAMFGICLVTVALRRIWLQPDAPRRTYSAA
jgi:signal peptidase I